MFWGISMTIRLYLAVHHKLLILYLIQLPSTLGDKSLPKKNKVFQQHRAFGQALHNSPATQMTWESAASVVHCESTGSECGLLLCTGRHISGLHVGNLNSSKLALRLLYHCLWWKSFEEMLKKTTYSSKCSDDDPNLFHTTRKSSEESSNIACLCRLPSGLLQT